MGKNVDYRQFEAFAKKLEKVDRDKQKFMEDCCKELAARLLSRVIKRTPVDEGALRRGWTGGAENVSEKGGVVGVGGKNGAASKINVVYRNGEYRCVIFNPISYSSYVEYGARTRGGKGWRDGVFMLSISEKEVESLSPALLEKRLMEFLKGAFE